MSTHFFIGIFAKELEIIGVATTVACKMCILLAARRHWFVFSAIYNNYRKFCSFLTHFMTMPALYEQIKCVAKWNCRLFFPAFLLSFFIFYGDMLLRKYEHKHVNYDVQRNWKACRQATKKKHNKFYTQNRNCDWNWGKLNKRIFLCKRLHHSKNRCTQHFCAIVAHRLASKATQLF